MNYKDSKSKVDIICKDHGIFKQKPHNHLNGQDCPKCKSSKGINKLMNILIDRNITFITEQTIDGCLSKNSKKLRFDIYIPSINTFIEFDGMQHFKPIKSWGGEKSFIDLKERDFIKNEFCRSNNIKLIRISYLDDIKSKLDSLFGWV